MLGKWRFKIKSLKCERLQKNMKTIGYLISEVKSMKIRFIKRILITVCIGLFALGMYGCDEITGRGGTDTLKMTSNWDRIGLKNHINGGANCGALNTFAVEPLIQYVRSTDEVFYILAESTEHNTDGTSLIHLRESSKWHDGTSFTADDVIAYYYINQLEATNYKAKIEKINEKLVKITWKAHMEPNVRVKDLILAIDPVGSVQYKEFKTYVDEVVAIMDGADEMPDGYLGWAPFGKIVNNDESTACYANYAAFTAHNPTWFVGTGVFKPFSINETDMILKKDETHWLAKYVAFNFVHAYNSISDLTQVVSMLKNGNLDMGGGDVTNQVIQEVINSNKDLAYYAFFDPGACGLLFNQSKKVMVNGAEEKLFNDDIREAFQYLFDRTSIAFVANPYSIPTYRSLMAMAPSEAQKYMSKAAWDSLEVFEYNQQKAADMLAAAGWSKVSGKWHGKDGNKLSFTLHFDGGNSHQANAAQAAASQLNAFGIDTQLKSSSSWADWFGSAQSTVWSAELSLSWTDLNMSISYPSGSFVYGFRDVTHKVTHIDKYPVKGEPGWEAISEKDLGAISVELPFYGRPGTYRLTDHIQGLYSLSDEDLMARIDDIITGVASQNWGVPFYQNVARMFINLKAYPNAPRQDLIKINRILDVVPEPGTQDAYDFARLSAAFAGIASIVDWTSFFKEN